LPMLDTAFKACAGMSVEIVPRLRTARPGAHDWAVVLERDAHAAEPVAVPSETPLLIVYTSGTTGAPKGVIHVHGGFLVKAGAELAYHMDVGGEDVLNWLTDLGWILGPWQLIGANLAGAAVVLYPGAPDFPAVDRLWRLYEEQRVTIAGVSPTLIRALAAHGEEPVRRCDLSSLRILGSTGEPWDPASYRWFFETVGGGRRPVINLSGGTEVGACFLGQVPVIPAKPCSVGKPSPGMAVDVYDSVGKPVRGAMGELVCTQPWPGQTRGFLDDRDRYLKTYWDTWPGVWTHGDWASVDEDGYWFLHGRSDDTLKIAGKRLGPSEVEAAAMAARAVADCVAVGIPDPVKGEAVLCVCTTLADGEPDPALEGEVRDAVTAALGKAFAPAKVLLVPDLPRTRSGKPVRRLVRDRLLGRDVGDVSSVANPEALDAIERVAA
jgi:acetyl-CoA synthetase